jgi:hypothetical protein
MFFRKITPRFYTFCPCVSIQQPGSIKQPAVYLLFIHARICASDFPLLFHSYRILRFRLVLQSACGSTRTTTPGGLGVRFGVS